MKAETDGEDCGGPGSATDPNPQQSPDSLEMEVSFGDKLHKPEIEDSYDGRKKSRTLESGKNEDLEFNSANTSFNCSDCGKHFLYRQTLQRHQNPHSQMAGHKEERLFDCDVCGHKFKREANLTTHIRVHTGEKPFSCNVCEKKFRHQYNLYRHLKIHTGKKSFSCATDFL
uniref:C2H2-type domain-containing protein n=1 Tax=Maylandia zebra TaxID=106582 RepID=A0A3P9BU64_9CICH